MNNMNKDFLKFESLVSLPLNSLSSELVLVTLSHNLESIDISLLTKFFGPIDNLLNYHINKDNKYHSDHLYQGEDFFIELAIICRDKAYAHPEWSLLSGRVRMLYIKRVSPASFKLSTMMMEPILADHYYNYCMKYGEELNQMIDPSNDWKFDIFSVETLMKGYLTGIRNSLGTSCVVETPQYLYMRIAVFLWKSDTMTNPDVIKQTYIDLSTGKISAPSPLQFNAGTKKSQVSSCFLIGIDDTTESIKKSWGDSATISANNGGLGMCFDSIRHSDIGNDGWSRGLVPWIKIQNEILATVDQCFHPDTIVYTIKDGPKRIADVGPGEKLIRSDGKTTKVLRPIVYDVKKDGIFYKLSAKHCASTVIVSNCHPFLAINNQHEALSFDEIIERLDTKKTAIEYTEVEKLNTDSFMGIPIPTHEKDLPHYTNDDCRMYGILLSSSDYFSDDYKLYVLLEKNQTETLKFVKNYLISKGIKYLCKLIDDNDVQIEWPQIHRSFSITKKMLHENKDGNKNFYPAFLHLPIEKLEQLFLGIVEAGNYSVYTPKKTNFNKIRINLGPLQVIESVKYILLRMKILTSNKCVNFNIHIKSMNENVVFRSKINTSETLTIPITPRINELIVLKRLDQDLIKISNNCEIIATTNNKNKLEYFEYDGKLWSRLTKKELITNNDFSMIVHDLEMEKVEGTDEEISANYLTCIGIAHNGGKRKGSGTMWTCIWHVDIYEFIDLKNPEGKEEVRARELFYGIMIHDIFMRRVKNDEMWSLFCPAKSDKLQLKYGDEFEESYLELEKLGLCGNFPNTFRQVKARELWLHILRSQKKNGMPFIKYKDAVNRKNNQINLGTIRMSNLCVSGDTKILTINGQIAIKLLENKNIDIWNGQEWSNVTIRKTATNKDLLRVRLSNGSFIDCTPEHKFYVKDISSKGVFGIGEKLDIVEIRAQNLSKNQELINYILPVASEIQSIVEFKYSYTHGYVCGNTIDAKHTSKLILAGKQTMLVQYINYRGREDKFSTLGGTIIQLLLPSDMLPKFIVPHQAQLSDKLRWFEGLCDADGIIGCDNVMLVGCSSYNFAHEIQLMLQTLGVKSSTIFRDNDTKNLNYHQLSIKLNGLYTLNKLGFMPKLLKMPINFHKSSMKDTVKVINVVESLKNVDTYCFNEPIRNMGMFNGVLAGNCVEIDEYVDKDNIASCNLSSIVVSKFVKFISCNGPNDTPYFDFDELGQVTRRTLRNLRQMIERTYYPPDVPQIRYTNMRNRPIGVGIQGLADAFCMMDYCWDSKEAAELNEKIARVMYYHAMDENIIMAKDYGHYETFKGSPASKGLFQFDLWDKEKHDKLSKIAESKGIKLPAWTPIPPCSEFEWDLMRSDMIIYGLYYSLVFAQMPTASSAHILGNNESVEPYTQLMFARTVLSGQFVVSVTHFVKDLENIGLWNDNVLRHLFDNQGSIQTFEDDTLSDVLQRRLTYIKKKYRTAFELSQKVLADLYFGRARYQCQSTSHNVFMKNPTTTALNAYHMGMFNGGAKTGMYYLRQTAGSDPLNFSLDSIHVTTKKSNVGDNFNNIDGNYEVVECTVCGS